MFGVVNHHCDDVHPFIFVVKSLSTSPMEYPEVKLQYQKTNKNNGAYIQWILLG